MNFSFVGLREMVGKGTGKRALTFLPSPAESRARVSLFLEDSRKRSFCAESSLLFQQIDKESERPPKKSHFIFSNFGSLCVHHSKDKELTCTRAGVHSPYMSGHE